MALTERAIRDAKPGAKNLYIWDRDVKGFGLRITPAGAAAFILNYRVDGAKRRATIGRPAEMSLKDARERAGRMLAETRDGVDPLAQRRERMEAPTVADGIERFFSEYVPRRKADGRLSERTEWNYRKQWGRIDAAWPNFAKLKISDVTRHDIEKAVAPRAPIERNRTIAFLSRLFNLFEAWEYRPLHSNPTAHIEKAREQPRDRVLTAEEMAGLAAALEAESAERPAAVAAILVAALTGLRISEVLAMQWEHIDAATGRLLLPKTKTGRRWHDLPEAALKVLSRLPRINGNDWCFTTGRAGRNAAITYKTAHKVFSRAAKAAGIADVRLHDLRRTLATRAAAAGVSTLALRDMLGWKSTAMPARYVQLAGETAREHRQAVGAQIAAMMEGK